MKFKVKFYLGLVIFAITIINLTVTLQNINNDVSSLLGIRQAIAAPTEQGLLNYGFSYDSDFSSEDYDVYYLRVDHTNGTRSDAYYVDYNQDGVMDSRHYQEFDSRGNMVSQTDYYY